jgi:hypothetical protein
MPLSTVIASAVGPDRHSWSMAATPRYDHWMMRVIERQLGAWERALGRPQRHKLYADWRPLVEDHLVPAACGTS